MEEEAIRVIVQEAIAKLKKRDERRNKKFRGQNKKLNEIQAAKDKKKLKKQIVEMERMLDDRAV